MNLDFFYGVCLEIDVISVTKVKKLKSKRNFIKKRVKKSKDVNIFFLRKNVNNFICRSLDCFIKHTREYIILPSTFDENQQKPMTPFIGVSMGTIWIK